MTIKTQQQHHRRKSGTGSRSFPEDDLNQSYVFNFQEDQRACEADEQRSSHHNNHSSSKHKTNPKSNHGSAYTNASVSPRYKKRQLESQSGKSAPNLRRPPRRNGSKSLSPKGQSMAVTPSSKSGRLPQLSLLPSSKTHETFQGSEDSLDLGDLQEKNTTKSRIHSKASTGDARHNLRGSRNTNNCSLATHIGDSNSSAGRLARNKASKASRGSRSVDKSLSSFSSGFSGGANGTARRTVQMRDTDRLLRGDSRGIEPQDSGAGKKTITRGRRRDRSVPRRGSGTLIMGQNSKTSLGTTSPHSKQSTRSKSSIRSGHSAALIPVGSNHRARLTERRGRSVDRGRSKSSGRPPVTRPGRSTSGGPRSRSVSADRSRPPQTVCPTKKRSRSQSIDRYGSDGSRVSAVSDIRSVMSSTTQPTIIKQGDKTVVFIPVTAEQARRLPVPPKNGRIAYLQKGSFYPSYFPRKIPPMEEKPPKSLVLIWVVVSAELGFDLATTIIAFLALVEEDECCGEQMELGPIPMTVTAPFFLLVIAELTFLSRAMILTMWPSIFTGETTDADLEIRNARTSFMKMCCCCLRWNAKAVLKVLNFLVLLNPFFGCVIAWMLLYQSNKVESFVVLGLEGGSILLHFFSVYLEGSCKTWAQFLCHCIPLLPFMASITLILFYLKQGGVCYIVEKELFSFTGCTICPDALPPIDGVCTIRGTNFTVTEDGLFDFSDGLSSLGDELTRRAEQGEFCGNQVEGGPDVSFCFFSYN